MQRCKKCQLQDVIGAVQFGMCSFESLMSSEKHHLSVVIHLGKGKCGMNSIIQSVACVIKSFSMLYS